MPKFLIEREVPGASELSPAELHSISKRSVGVLRQLGPDIQWIESYVAGNNLYCVYVAPDAEMVREHGRLGGVLDHAAEDRVDRAVEIAHHFGVPFRGVLRAPAALDNQCQPDAHEHRDHARQRLHAERGQPVRVHVHPSAVPTRRGLPIRRWSDRSCA